MKHQVIRRLDARGDSLLAEWDQEQGIKTAEQTFNRLKADPMLHVMDETTEEVAKAFVPDHSYTVFQRMAGG